MVADSMAIFKIREIQGVAEECFVLDRDSCEVLGTATDWDDDFRACFEVDHHFWKEGFSYNIIVDVDEIKHTWVIENDLSSHFSVTLDE